jgi:lipopolysaccharide export system protein LptA
MALSSQCTSSVPTGSPPRTLARWPNAVELARRGLLRRVGVWPVLAWVVAGLLMSVALHARAAAEDVPGSTPAGFSLPGSDKGEPVHINADLLEFDARQNVATFRGDVVSSQGAVVMRSALLRATFAPSANGKSGSMQRLQSLVAEGNVHITYGNRVARGKRAEFNNANRTLVLSGDAVVYEGPNEVRGERVVVYLDEQRSVVEGTSKRVKAILVPDASAPGGGDAEDDPKVPTPPAEGGDQ